MEDKGFVVLDTRAFDAVIEKKEDLITSYAKINEEYDRIVKSLLDNWKGRGADAFQRDAQTVKTNIVGIYDILKIMCDTLTDCRKVFEECDKTLGDFNRNPNEVQE